jgi:hypothetical protein
LIFLSAIVHFVGGPAKRLHDLRPISPNTPHQFDCIVENSATFEHGSNLIKGDAYAALRRLLDVIESCGAIGEPQDVFAIIEEDLRARMAVPVEQKLQSAGHFPFPSVNYITDRPNCPA